MKRVTGIVDGRVCLFCRACNALRPIDAFYKRSGSGRPDSHCKPCRAKQMRAYDQRHRAERLAYWRQAGADRRAAMVAA